ncbi:hypothetical protein MTP39_03435 [Faecalibacterium sp. I3-3-33]|uniref:hypothetical protein n=1 Tax=Faecalibacterium sp. I3-3-33 TaxID=2929492 RepID=UPI002014AA4B|nr:hypothetical protein [Faecalibacterium sp. I3-3-33]UQK46295.1 hypothetical protein MTP39_03435 [Faecalibacterium sp. I3-3-33]
MTDTITRLRTSNTAKCVLALAAAAVLLAVFAQAAPGSVFFFPLVSLWCNLALFACVLLVLRVAGVKFDLFHKAVLVGLWAAALLYFFWALDRRSFVYIWDYFNYINKQYSAEAAFLQGPAAGFQYIFGSFAEDYTNFITLFLDFPFCLSDRTGDSFAFCQVFSILPMLLVLLAGLTIKVGQMLQVKNRFWYFLMGFSWCITFPFLRMSAMLGQPDWFGLIFGFSILLLTLDFRFESLQPVRFCLLFAATAAIILSRRWYLYLVVGYYFAYALLVLVSSVRIARAGQKTQALVQVRNLVLFGLMSMVAMLILLWPMVRKILSYDYAGRYAYYNFGGLTLELAAQALRIGLLNFILIGLGLWFAAKRRLPALPCLAGAELLISLLLFIRVQNSGSHQMLLFLPGWLLLFLTGAAALAEGIQKHRELKLFYWVFTLVFAVSVRCSPLTVVAMPGFLVDHFPLEATREFVRLDKLIYDRKDLPQIKAIANWIDTHCAEGELSYMIPHDMLYCPDHFKNCLLPETPINDKLAFGFSVPGTHNFPMQFFEAKYVLTADPFPQTFVGNGELSHRWNDRFLAVREESFALEATFDMGNGTTFTIWRRTAAPTRAEVEYYLSAFTEEDAQYPEMFSEIAESWLAARGL